MANTLDSDLFSDNNPPYLLLAELFLEHLLLRCHMLETVT